MNNRCKLYDPPVMVYLKYWQIVLVVFFAGWLGGCQLLQKKKMEAEFLTTRIMIVQSKIDGGDIMGAQYDMVSLRQKYPDNHDILTLSGFVDITLGNHQRAVENMLKAHKLNSSALSLLNLSAAYIAAQNYNAALRAVNDGIQLGQQENYVDLGRLYHNRGYIFELKQQNHLAIKNYKEALYHLPGYLQTLARLTQLFEALGRHSDAIPYYQRYIYFCRSCFEPVEKLALYYIKLGDSEVAEKLVAHYLKNPELSEKFKQQAKQLHHHAVQSSSLRKSPVRPPQKKP